MRGMSESDQPPSERTLPDRLHDALMVPAKLWVPFGLLYFVTFEVLPFFAGNSVSDVDSISWAPILVKYLSNLLTIAFGPMAVLKFARWLLNKMASEYRK